MKPKLKIKLGLIIGAFVLIPALIIFSFFLLQNTQKGAKFSPATDNNQKIINDDKKEDKIASEQENLIPGQEPPKPLIQNNGEGEIFQISSLKKPYFIIVIDKNKKSHTLEISPETLIKIFDNEFKGVALLSYLKVGDKVSFTSKGEPGKSFIAQTITLKQRASAPEPKEIYSYEGKIKEMTENYFILTLVNGKEIKVNFDENTKFLGAKPQLGEAVMVTNPDQNLKGKTEIYAKYIQKL